MRAPRSEPQSDNLFKFNMMRNRVGLDNSLESRLTDFIFNDITASMTRDSRNLTSTSPERPPLVPKS